MTNARKELSHGIVMAGVLIGSALAMLGLRAAGIVGVEMMPRVFGILYGLMLAGYGNVIPRKLVRWEPESDRPARRQACLRFCGWVFTLAGLAHAAVWAFVPFDRVALWSMAPILAAFLLVGARLVLRKAARPA